MENKKFETYLLFSTSRDGWKAKDFHSRCDGKGPTVSLFRTEKNECVGGFTMAQWSSPKEAEFKKDKTAFLFNLNTNKVFKCKDKNKAIRCSINEGPCFGN